LRTSRAMNRSFFISSIVGEVFVLEIFELLSFELFKCPAIAVFLLCFRVTFLTNCGDVCPLNKLVGTFVTEQQFELFTVKYIVNEVHVTTV
jgi:hypothetical protein